VPGAGASGPLTSTLQGAGGGGEGAHVVDYAIAAWKMSWHGWARRLSISQALRRGIAEVGCATALVAEVSRGRWYSANRFRRRAREGLWLQRL